MARRKEYHSSGEDLHPAVEQALEMMAREYQRNLSVKELATIAGLSPSRFSHVFRAAVGCAPIQYLKWLRMAEARRLLETTTLSVKEILHAAGFADRGHFSRTFRRTYGSTPREFRRAIVKRAYPGYASTESRANTA
jgi:AraC family transcriptional regulator of arabinose operon